MPDRRVDLLVDSTTIYQTIMHDFGQLIYGLDEC